QARSVCGSVTAARSARAAREERGDLEAVPRARAVVILTTEHHAPESAFGPIVVERNARVVEKARQPRPQPEQITDGLPRAALWQRPLGQRPRLNLADDRARALVAQPTAPRQEFAPHHFVLAAHRRKRRHLTLDGVQL